MKKTIFSVALVIAGLVGFSSYADNNTTQQATSTEAVQTQNDNNNGCHGRDGRHDKKDRKGCHKGQAGRQHDRRGQHAKRDLFKGIELTADQQARIDALKPQRTNNDEQCGAQCRDNKNESCQGQQCQRGERRGQRQEGRRGNGRMNGERRAQFIEQVKEILTPDQYVIFLENMVMPAQSQQQAVQTAE